MKITLHLDLEEVDYLAIVRAANFKRKSTEDFIREAIRDNLERALLDMQLEEVRTSKLGKVETPIETAKVNPQNPKKEEKSKKK